MGLCDFESVRNIFDGSILLVHKKFAVCFAIVVWINIGILFLELMDGFFDLVVKLDQLLRDSGLISVFKMKL